MSKRLGLLQDGRRRVRRLGRGTVIATLAVALSAVPAMSSPSAAGAAPVTVGTSQLLGVACPSAIVCFAVGYTTDPNYSVIERWNGTSWSIVQGPNSAHPVGGVLSSVACLSASSCFAVGGTLIERWNGTTWSVVTGASLYPGWSGYLEGVSCAATFCLAVGGQSGGGNSRTLVERWDGTTWSVLPAPYATGPSSPFLNSVSCRSTTLCVAVGWFTDTAGLKQTLIERWDGTSVTAVPSLNAAAGNSYLQSVSCPTTTSCVAVGRFFDPTVFPIGQGATLVERWNGTSWSLESTPHIPSPATVFWGVSCVGATMCLAVGSRMLTYVTPGLLVERWNGTTWSIIANPSGGIRSELFAVKCASTTICFAVGHSSGLNEQNTMLIARWNGTSWTTQVDGNP